MKIAITGGAGFIGRACADEIHRAGHEVVLLGRRKQSVFAPDGSQYAFAECDVNNLDDLTRCLAGVDAVVHCVGIILEPKGVTFESVVAEGTKKLVAACQNAGVKQIVYISALGTRPNAISRYHQTKWIAEEAIRSSGLHYAILRPSIVYGRGDKFINTFIKMPVLVLPGGGKGLFQPVFVKDLAKMAALAVDGSAKDQTVDAGGPAILTYREMMQTALKLKGKKKIEVPLPMWFMGLLATIHDPFQKIYPPLALLTKDQYKMMLEPNAGDIDQTRSAFPELKLHTLTEGLGTYLKSGI